VDLKGSSALAAAYTLFIENLRGNLIPYLEEIFRQFKLNAGRRIRQRKRIKKSAVTECQGTVWFIRERKRDVDL
jgi:hypothetical protein